jgi:hypothetical protein
VGGSTGLLAACGSDKKGGRAPISDVNDVVVLNSALDLEHHAVAAYTAALDG